MNITYEQVENALFAFAGLSHVRHLREAQEFVLACEFDAVSGNFQKVVLVGGLPAMLKGLAVSEVCIKAFEDLQNDEGGQQVDALCCFKAHDDNGFTYLITSVIRSTFANGQLCLLADTIIKH